MRRVLIFVLLLLSAATCASAREIRIAAFGDSLSAGYGLAERDGFAPALQRELRKRGLEAQVINAGVSGDTSRDGLLRLEYLLSTPGGFDAVIVEFGANDFRRGFPPSQTRANLGAILSRLREAGVKALLAGMDAPGWLGFEMGEQYAAEFKAIFAELASEYDVPLYPFFLDGVAARPELNLADGVHPNPAGAAEIARRIAPFVMRAIAE